MHVLIVNILDGLSAAIRSSSLKVIGYAHRVLSSLYSSIHQSPSLRYSIQYKYSTPNSIAMFIMDALDIYDHNQCHREQ